ncbi:hypothetical protein [Brevibacillus dissolubilis]|uniref:hypothetical protein n=1 Tax=Brevibacillus dissolubilis TaxID=1844116 RepID=UPI001116B20B|nr:hypothetical protein [Brevibacillus dissolubilis]
MDITIQLGGFYFGVIAGMDGLFSLSPLTYFLLVPSVLLALFLRKRLVSLLGVTILTGAMMPVFMFYGQDTMFLIGYSIPTAVYVLFFQWMSRKIVRYVRWGSRL